MTKRIPPDAFEQYVALGDERSYEMLAERLGVAKRSITKKAAREKWQERLAKLERDAREQSESRLRESLASMRERHLRTVKVIQAKAIEALRDHSLESAMDAVRALDIAFKQERLIRGEPTERQAIGIEEVVKREYERWMAVEADDIDEYDEGNAGVEAVSDED